MNLSVERYAPDHKDEWDAFVASARNGVFLHRRDFMDYHADRFTDCSAIARSEGKVVAVLPASIDPDMGAITSHGGLTFGGLLVGKSSRGTETLAALDAVLKAMKNWGGTRLSVRLVPSFLQQYPSGDVEYGLWKRGFQIVRSDLSSVLPLRDALPVNRSKAQAIAAAVKAGIEVRDGEVETFHALLTDVLRDQHGTVPVHSLDELKLLLSRFPDELRIIAAFDGPEIVAGSLIFRYATAWHTQYLATSTEGRRVGALDAVIGRAIEEARADGARYFSFGISTTDAGRTLNEGLLWQKESFGARSVTHDVIEGDL